MSKKTIGLIAAGATVLGAAYGTKKLQEGKVQANGTLQDKKICVCPMTLTCKIYALYLTQSPWGARRPINQ